MAAEAHPVLTKQGPSTRQIMHSFAAQQHPKHDSVQSIGVSRARAWKLEADGYTWLRHGCKREAIQ